MHLETWKVLGVNGSQLFTYTVSWCLARRTWEWPRMYVPCGATGKAHPHVTHVSLRIQQEAEGTLKGFNQREFKEILTETWVELSQLNTAVNSGTSTDGKPSANTQPLVTC